MNLHPQFRSPVLYLGFLVAGLLAGPLLRAQTLTNLGTLGGTVSAASGINDSGQVVGYADTSGDAGSDAFLYSGGTMTNLGTLGGTIGQATGINASGQVVGYASTSGNAASDAFLYSGGTMTNLGTFGGTDSFATGINASGQVVGGADTSGNAAYNAFLYSGGTMTNLGTFGGTTSEAAGINASGQVVGYANTSGNAGSVSNAFLYSGGTMTNLGTLGGTTSYANGINASGQVVGDAETSGNAHFNAFIYTSSTGMENLNTLYASLLVSGTGPQEGFVSLTNATAINSSGEIVGYGVYWNGTTDHSEAFVLDAPEPSTWALLLGGLGGLSFLRQFHRRNAAANS
jgi:probable HAF family extracellular repeat protein